MRRNPEPFDTVTVGEAMGGVKAFFKVVGYLVTVVGAVVWVTRYLDKVDDSLVRINASLQNKASVSDLNHAFKILGDQNRDLIHKDGSTGLLVPEIEFKPARPTQQE
jgi:hypothetical protein